MSEETIYAGYSVFKAVPARLGHTEREVAAKEVVDLFEEWADRVQVRGAYSTVGFRGDADVMFWWISRSADDIQDLLLALRQTEAGAGVDQTEAFLGLVRPAEFATDHLPAFVQGKPPKKYACIYPFVRTAEWYLLDPQERGALLREHGEAGREYPDVLANTTSAFGLGDFEWILAFEADRLERIVELIRRLRATEARRYTKLEVPFFTGIRRDIRELLANLP